MMTTPAILPINTALISVSDKTGIVEFASFLASHGVRILSTGGTATSLRNAGIEVTDVSDVTGFPEIMDGRVKTLHPHIHGGILAKRDNPDHRQAMQAHEIDGIDLVVLNLYPFEQTLARTADIDALIENIDIGGPAMTRAAAKNHEFVGIVTHPDDYQHVCDAITEQGGLDGAMRRKLAQKAFAMTARYDQMISGWLDSITTDQKSSDGLPSELHLSAPQTMSLRYGENPHQKAGYYTLDTQTACVGNARQIQGKALSYNNINDTDAAFRLASEFSAPTIAIIKHANPCGVATADRLADAWQGAFEADPVSAFGGIIAMNRPLDSDTAQQISAIFSEVIIAPDADEQALEILSAKPNLRVLLTGGMADPAAPSMAIRSVAGGLLVQTADNGQLDDSAMKIVTEKHPSDAEMADLKMAWRIAKHVKSNAIVYVKDQISAAIGAGQMSRVDSCRIAAQKAQDMARHHDWPAPRTHGSVVASDAFFPFADGLLAAIDAGAGAVIQPGGSMRDDEVIAAANEAGIAMVFTGMRHFNH